MYRDDYINFHPFVGIVKDVESNRVRVRVFGVHPMEPEGQSSGPAYVAVSNGDLPWAVCVYPIDSDATTINLEVEDWVMGYFADGKSCQQPVVTGRLKRGDGNQGSNFLGGNGRGSSGTGGGGDSSLPSTKATADGKPVKVNNKTYYDNIPGDTHKQRGFNLYTTWLNEEKGMPLERSKEVAAGIVAGIQGESGWNPSTPPGDGGSSVGLIQWNNFGSKRKTGLYQMCGVGTNSLACQVNYSLVELENRNAGVAWEGKESSTKNQLLKQTTAIGALNVWVRSYERSKYQDSDVNKRSKYINAARALGANYQPATITEINGSANQPTDYDED